MMHWQYNPYVLPLILAASMSVAVAVFAWHRRPAPGAASLAYLMLAVTEWSLGYALGMASADLAAKVFWARVQYFGIVVVPVMWLILALQYTNRRQWLTRRARVLLVVTPLLTLLLAWTNDAHGLIWSDTTLNTVGSFSVLYLTYGGLFWVWVAFSYSCVLVGSLLLLQRLARSPHLYRQQALALLMGALAPWAGNALRISGLNLFSHLDLTNFAFTVSGLAVAWALFRFRLLDSVPIARDKVIEGMSDGMLVLDPQNRVVDINPAAEKLIGVDGRSAIGQLPEAVLSKWTGLADRYRDVLVAHAEVFVDGTGYVELRISPLYEQGGRFSGRLIVLRDITERKRAEQELQNTLAKLRAALGGIIQTVALTVETKDPYTAGHQRRTGDLARAIASELRLPQEQIEGIRMAGAIHDLGKVGVPAEILSRPGPLSDLQFGLIQAHSQIGYDVLKKTEFPWPVAQIVYQHHERLDGSGYPQGLLDEQILLEARVLAVADVVEAMASRRPYRPPRGLDEALGEISQNKGLLYDTTVVDACLRLFSERGFVLDRER